MFYFEHTFLSSKISERILPYTCQLFFLMMEIYVKNPDKLGIAKVIDNNHFDDTTTHSSLSIAMCIVLTYKSSY